MGSPFVSEITSAERVLWVNRRSGVAHSRRDCKWLDGVPEGALRRVSASDSYRLRLCRTCQEQAHVTRPDRMLTSRERDVLQLVAEGLQNAEIGGRLYLSADTIKFHVAQILGKFDAATRTQAVAIAIREGIIE
jgi:DNA-binding NarL/FixJ family response regulator